VETRTETRSATTTATGWAGARFYDNGVGGVIGFLGISGAGKTRKMGQRVLRYVQRAVVFNTVASYGRGPRQNPLPGYGLVATPAELVKYIGPRWRSGTMRVIYQPLSGNVEKHFDDVSRLVWEMRDVTFAIDEVWRFQKPGWSPDSLSNMILAGRMRGISLAWTSQRPQPVDKAMLAQSTELYIGLTVRDADISKLQEEFPLKDDAAAAIRTLGQWEMVHVKNDGTWKVEKP
jgi:hypothetical protein